MIPFLAIDANPRQSKPKLTAGYVRQLKHNLHIMSPKDRKRARKEIAQFEGTDVPKGPEERTAYYIPSSKMTWDIQNNACVCPLQAEITSRGKSYYATVAAEDWEDLTDWLEHYGCSWQEE